MNKNLNLEYVENMENVIAISPTEVENYWDKWKYLEDQSASADSRVGWSTAFFAIILSSLFVVGFELGAQYNWIWYIVLPLIVMTIIGIGFLVKALVPSKQNRIVREEYPHEVIKYLRKYSEWIIASKEMMDKDPVSTRRWIYYFIATKSLSVKNGEMDYWRKEESVKYGIINSLYKIPFNASTDQNILRGSYFNCAHGMAMRKALEDKEKALEILRNHITQKLNFLKIAYTFAIPFLWFDIIPSIIIMRNKVSEIKKSSTKIQGGKRVFIINKIDHEILKLLTSTSIAHYDEIISFLRKRWI